MIKFDVDSTDLKCSDKLLWESTEVKAKQTMTISELVDTLNATMAEHGDLPALLFGYTDTGEAIHEAVLPMNLYPEKCFVTGKEALVISGMLSPRLIKFDATPGESLNVG